MIHGNLKGLHKIMIRIFISIYTLTIYIYIYVKHEERRIFLMDCVVKFAEQYITGMF